MKCENTQCKRELPALPRPTTINFGKFVSIEDIYICELCLKVALDATGGTYDTVALDEK